MTVLRSPLHSPLRSPLYSPLVGKWGSGFDPAILFTDGEIGAWYDPTDITSLFQDSAGTTPVAAADDPVGMARDKSGLGNHATQATAGNRLVYKQNLYNGRSGLEVVTAGKKLVTPSIMGASFNTALTCYAVVQSSGTATKIFASASGANFYDGRVATSFHSVNTAALSDTNISTAGLGTTYLQAFTYDGAVKRLRAHGAASQILTREAATGNLTLSGGLHIGDMSSGGFTWDGSILGLLFINRVLTGEEQRNLLNWYKQKFALSVDVQPRVWCDGNSLTRGFGSSDPATESYPAQMAPLLPGWTITNLGLDGYTTALLDTQDATRLYPRYDITRPKDIVVMWEISNDLYGGGVVADALTRYATWCQKARDEGYKVIAATVLPRSGGSPPVTFEADRQTANTSVRANWATYADALADIAADTRIGDPGDDLDTTYYNADATHLNATGYGVVAGIVAPVVLSL